MSVSINGTNGLTFSDGTSQNTAATGFGFKNRIINGAMMIDQRNAGAAVGTSINGYTVDRWALYANPTGKVNGGQNYNSLATLPAGFTNYLGFQSQSAYTIGASEYVLIRQNIEGFNTADLNWGTANAKTVTLSFWVYSSLTGTFGGSLFNPNQGTTVCYPFSYTISSANTWQQISVTIAGPTSGTFGTTNSGGIGVTFSLASGSSVSGTAGAWVTANYYSATGATSVVGTNGATFYITGVQLEKGSTATSFDYRPYGTELALCQRYYQTRKDGFAMLVQGPTTGNNTYISSAVPFIVTMRSSPTMTFFDRSNTSGQITILTSGSSMNGTDLAGPYGSSATADYVLAQTYNEGTRYGFRCGFTASAEL